MKEAVITIEHCTPEHVKYGEKLHRIEIYLQSRQDGFQIKTYRIRLRSRNGFSGGVEEQFVTYPWHFDIDWYSYTSHANGRLISNTPLADGMLILFKIYHSMVNWPDNVSIRNV